MRILFISLIGLLIVTATGCETTKRSTSKRHSIGGRTDAWESTKSWRESGTPDWWFARREFDPNYAHWGKMRPLDASPNSERWVLLNEDQCKAPHRKLAKQSADNHREYRFFGFFSDKKGYEPASDEFCPVFVLQKWDPINPEANPPAPPPQPAPANP